MSPEDKPLTLMALVELISGESDVETRLRAGNSLKGPSIQKMLDPEERLGFWDKAIAAEDGYAEFQKW